MTLKGAVVDFYILITVLQAISNAQTHQAILLIRNHVQHI